MGTILKYALYLVILFVIYLVIAGFYEGRLDNESTVSEVTEEVSDNAKRIINDATAKTRQE